jgi:hypothetical protein
MTASYILTYNGGYAIARATGPAGEEHVAYGFSPHEAIANLRGQPGFQSWLQKAGLPVPLDSEFILQAPDDRRGRRGHNHGKRPALRLVVSNGRMVEN